MAYSVDRLCRQAPVAAVLLLPAVAAAHSFGPKYSLPLPFWLYAWGAAAALVSSFLILGLFVSHAPGAPAVRDLSPRLGRSRLRRFVLPPLRLLVLAGMVLLVVAGFIGTPRPADNIAMTGFWIVFLLGVAYLSALVGDVYAALNPWRTLARMIGFGWRRYCRGLVRYPSGLGYWPAFCLYVPFIWLELFAGSRPPTVAWLLSGYTVLNLVGVLLVGERAWFRHCELFSVLFRQFARMAPLQYRPDEPGPRLSLQAPFLGALSAPVSQFGLLMFILFMLSSTAFDGLHETGLWKRLFWSDLYHAVLIEHVGDNPLAALPAMREYWGYWNTAALLISPWLYLGVYLAFIALSRWLGGGTHTVRELALSFAGTLLPIALVYNVAHYYTLVQVQGVKILPLLSDPFGRYENWLGTAEWFRGAIVPDPNTVWHTQAALIVAGHIISVWLAHREALRLFPTRRQALLSQLPMLLLMVGFTASGLWILSLPLGS